MQGSSWRGRKTTDVRRAQSALGFIGEAASAKANDLARNSANGNDRHGRRTASHVARDALGPQG
jgi:hypothetical protein